MYFVAKAELLKPMTIRRGEIDNCTIAYKSITSAGALQIQGISHTKADHIYETRDRRLGRHRPPESQESWLAD